MKTGVQQAGSGSGPEELPLPETDSTALRSVTRMPTLSITCNFSRRAGIYKIQHWGYVSSTFSAAN